MLTFIVGKEKVLESLFESLMDDPDIYDRFCDRIEQGMAPHISAGK